MRRVVFVRQISSRSLVFAANEGLNFSTRQIHPDYSPQSGTVQRVVKNKMSSQNVIFYGETRILAWNGSSRMLDMLS